MNNKKETILNILVVILLITLFIFTLVYHGNKQLEKEKQEIENIIETNSIQETKQTKSDDVGIIVEESRRKAIIDIQKQWFYTIDEMLDMLNYTEDGELIGDITREEIEEVVQNKRLVDELNEAENVYMNVIKEKCLFLLNQNWWDKIATEREARANNLFCGEFIR